MRVQFLFEVEPAELAEEGALPAVTTHVLHELATLLALHLAHGAGVPHPPLPIHL